MRSGRANAAITTRETFSLSHVLRRPAVFQTAVKMYRAARVADIAVIVSEITHLKNAGNSWPERRALLQYLQDGLSTWILAQELGLQVRSRREEQGGAAGGGCQLLLVGRLAASQPGSLGIISQAADQDFKLQLCLSLR